MSCSPARSLEESGSICTSVSSVDSMRRRRMFWSRYAVSGGLAWALRSVRIVCAQMTWRTRRSSSPARIIITEIIYWWAKHRSRSCRKTMLVPTAKRWQVVQVAAKRNPRLLNPHLIAGIFRRSCEHEYYSRTWFRTLFTSASDRSIDVYIAADESDKFACMRYNLLRFIHNLRNIYWYMYLMFNTLSYCFLSLILYKYVLRGISVI